MTTRLNVIQKPITDPLEPSDRLDCVIVGYYDIDIRQVEAGHRRLKDHSGAYRNFLSNTAAFRGERHQLMHVLNETIADATSRRSSLNVAELPNLGGCYLKSYLQRRGLNVALVNFFNSERDALVALLEQSPRAVAITTTFYVDSAPIVDLVKFVRQYSTETRIIVGGPFVSNTWANGDPELQRYTSRVIGADYYICDSQGEASLYALLASLRHKNGEIIRDVPNLIYAPANGAMERSARIPENNSLDENIIDWDFFDRQRYVPTVQMRTARSCAFNCAFCRYPVVAGALTLTSIDRVETELRQLHQAGVQNVVFVDDTFNVPLPRFKELCRMMIRNLFGFSWFSYFRCSNADDETFSLMRESGCRGVFLGIESADAAVLKNMNKHADPSRYRYGIGKLKEYDILTFASLIVGYPGETEDSVRHTMEFVEQAAPTFYRAELYYHDVQTPVQQSAAEYRIERAGYSWRHRTMDWQEACDHIDAMYRSVRSSIVLPLYMFDFWSIPYLIGKGIPLETLKQWMGAAQTLILPAPDHDTATLVAAERQLVSVLRSGLPRA